MSEQNSPKEEPFINIQDLWYLFLSNWYWFALSVFITVTTAVLYLAVTPPVYTRTISMLIKDNSKGSSSDNMAAFSELGLIKSNTNIQNEIMTLKAPALMQEVAKRLSLSMNYYIQGRFRDQDLYGQSPISIQLDSLAESNSFSFEITLLPEGKVSIADFTRGNEELTVAPIVGHLLDALVTPFGKLTIALTQHHSDKYLHTPIRFSKESLRGTAQFYSTSLNVALADENGTVVNLSITDASTQRAEDILAALIAVYNENWVKDKNEITVSTSQFISERLGVIENELGNVDNSISNFKSQNLLPDIQAATSMYMAQSSENRTQYLALNNKLTMARYIRNYLSSSTKSNQLLPANSDIGSQTITSQIAQYNTLLLQRNNLLTNSSEKNPLVMDLNQSLTTLREAINRSVDDQISTLNIQIENTKHSEKKTNQDIASNPDQAKYLLSVERQQKVKEALYLFLLQKREENELSQTFTAYNTKVVNPPAGSNFPIKPQKGTVLLAALAIGLLLPALILFVLNNLSTKVRDRKDLQVLTIPFAGEIPLSVGKKERKKANSANKVLIEAHNRNSINEAFRTLRTNIDFMRDKSKSCTVTMLTSMSPWSGKTFVTMNLAASMAIKGSRAVVVDLDLRKASLSTYVNSPQKGVSNYLNGEIDDVQQIIIKEMLMPNLDVIPVGTVPPNPAELLLTDRLTTLINQLRQDYDYIFLDCTPVEIVTDAAIVAQQADSTLFIIRVGLMDRRTLPEVEDIYQKGTLNNMSVILNATFYDGNRYGYHKHEYGRYGYSENK